MSRTALSLLFALVITAIPAQTEPMNTQVTRIGSVPIIPNGIVTPPQVASHRVPAYTLQARQRGVEGVVTIEAAFEPDGAFRILRVVKGLGFGLDNSALAALRYWRFVPAVRNGVPVSVVAEIDVEFSLENARVPWTTVVLHFIDVVRDVVRNATNGRAETRKRISPPKVIQAVPVQYPTEGREAGLQGSVVLDCVIAPNGHLVVSRVVESLSGFAERSGLRGADFDGDAIRALRQWRFEPPTTDSDPAALHVQVTVQFNLGK